MTTRYDIIYGKTPEILSTAVARFLETPEGRNWEPSGGPFEDHDSRRWGQAVRLQNGAKQGKAGEVNLRERR